MTATLDVVADLARQAHVVGGPDSTLSSEDVRQFILAELAEADLDGRSVCLVVPDGTRSSPLPRSCAACTRPSPAGSAGSRP